MIILAIDLQAQQSCKLQEIVFPPTNEICALVGVPSIKGPACDYLVGVETLESLKYRLTTTILIVWHYTLVKREDA